MVVRDWMLIGHLVEAEMGLVLRRVMIMLPFEKRWGYFFSACLISKVKSLRSSGGLKALMGS